MTGTSRLFIVTVAGLLSTTARAGIQIHVDVANCPGPGSGSEGDPYCSIQDAIDAAAETDEIVVEQGTYVGGSTRGGGLGSYVACSPAITDCTFLGNTATDRGGGLWQTNSDSVVTGCTFAGNTAGGFGGGIRANQPDTTPVVTNCVLWGNTDPQIVDKGGAVSTVAHSDVEGGYAGTGNIGGATRCWPTPRGGLAPDPPRSTPATTPCRNWPP